VPKVTWQVVSVRNDTQGGIPVVIKTLLGHVDNSADPAITVNIELILTTPAHASGPVPVMLEISFEGYPGAKPPALPEMGWRQLVLARRLGLCHPAPDFAFSRIMPPGLRRASSAWWTAAGRAARTDEWGTIRAWAWGASRALDYFETDKSVDAHQIGIEGHSRFGKTALVAMAYDPRFAILIQQLLRHGRRQALAARLWRAPGEPRRVARVPLDGRELSALCRAAHTGRPARRLSMS
jgi:hypothetical protein